MYIFWRAAASLNFILWLSLSAMRYSRSPRAIAPVASAKTNQKHGALAENRFPNRDGRRRRNFTAHHYHAHTLDFAAAGDILTRTQTPPFST
jgi:hypothetical protein